MYGSLLRSHSHKKKRVLTKLCVSKMITQEAKDQLANRIEMHHCRKTVPPCSAVV